MKKRLLVTGGRGFVAGSILRQASPVWEVHAASRAVQDFGLPELHWHVLAEEPADGIAALIRSIRPDSVIHTAALSNIDYCQAHPESARQVNVEFTREIAEACRAGGAKLVYCSTDNVFDGARGPYRESDPALPIHVYGETKRAGEDAALAAPGGVAARLSVVVGLPMLGAGNSFLSRMISQLDAGQEVGVPENEIRTPLDVVTAGRALLELAENDFSGLIHLAGKDRINRCAAVQYIAGRLGYAPERIVPNDPTGIPGRADRPLDVSLDNQLAQRVLRTPMQPLSGAMDLILAARK